MVVPMTITEDTSHPILRDVLSTKSTNFIPYRTSDGVLVLLSHHDSKSIYISLDRPEIEADSNST